MNRLTRQLRRQSRDSWNDHTIRQHFKIIKVFIYKYVIILTIRLVSSTRKKTPESTAAMTGTGTALAVSVSPVAHAYCYFRYPGDRFCVAMCIVVISFIFIAALWHKLLLTRQLQLKPHTGICQTAALVFTRNWLVNNLFPLVSWASWQVTLAWSSWSRWSTSYKTVSPASAFHWRLTCRRSPSSAARVLERAVYWRTSSGGEFIQSVQACWNMAGVRRSDYTLLSYLKCLLQNANTEKTLSTIEDVIE